MACGCDNTRNYYRYYDTPDGCDVEKKIMTTTRYGIVAGLIMSTYDVLMFSHAVGIAPIMKRYIYHTVPLGLMGATFAAVANGMQHWRQQDDHLNYFTGGMACGPVVAAYLRSGHGLLLGGLFLGVIAMIKKEAVETGFTFFQKFPDHMNTINGWRNDFTLVTDPRDEWLHTCVPPEEQ